MFFKYLNGYLIEFENNKSIKLYALILKKIGRVVKFGIQIGRKRKDYF